MTLPAWLRPDGDRQRFTGSRAYLLALLTTIPAVAITHATWPVFARAPYFLLFLAAYVTARWGSARAGFAATLLGAVSSSLALPDFGPLPVRIVGILIFMAVAGVAAHLAGEHNHFIRALQQSEAQFRATWEHAALGAALVNPTGEVLRINPALERILGHPPKSWVGHRFDRFVHPDDAEPGRQQFSRLAEDPDAGYQIEIRFRRLDGEWAWCRVTVSTVRDRENKPSGMLMSFEDVSARRKAEADLRLSDEKLRRAQKMEAVGQLVAGVAHNFNNLLTISTGYTDLLLERHPEGDPDHPDLQEIRKATSRGAVLTRQLLAFSRRKPTRPIWLDLNVVVADLRDILTRVIREDIKLSLRLAPGVAGISMDPHDLEQTIVNLVLNARDALPSGGSIELEVSKERIAESEGSGDGPVAPGEYARLRVRDNGSGMTDEVKGHLFEPFFTTKDVGSGTGLGLAFVYGVVRQHHGFITFDTAPGAGTTFDLYFPLSREAPARAAASVPQAAPSRVRPGTTLLMVEDEEGVRAVAGMALTQAGYRVLEAESPADALALFDAHRDEIALLVSDVVMPEMPGPVLAGRLVQQRPQLPVLFMSGYTDALPDLKRVAAHVGFLAKPFAPGLLVSRVGELLTQAEHESPPARRPGAG